MNQDLEAGRVTGQLEQPQDTDNGEKLENVGVLDVAEMVLQQHV